MATGNNIYPIPSCVLVDTCVLLKLRTAQISTSLLARQSSYMYVYTKHSLAITCMHNVNVYKSNYTKHYW